MKCFFFPFIETNKIIKGPTTAPWGYCTPSHDSFYCEMIEILARVKRCVDYRSQSQPLTDEDNKKKKKKSAFDVHPPAEIFSWVVFFSTNFLKNQT